VSAKQPEFETPAQASRRNLGRWGVTGRGADILIIIDDPLKPEEALSQSQRMAGTLLHCLRLSCRGRCG